MNDALHGAAFHEAGHVVVARHFGQKMTAVEIYEDGGGKTDTEGPIDHLSRIDRIAIAYAGLASQKNAPCREHFTTSSRSPAGEPASRRRGMDGTVARYLS
jgi:hypothetical protein